MLSNRFWVKTKTSNYDVILMVRSLSKVSKHFASIAESVHSRLMKVVPNDSPIQNCAMTSS